MNKPTNDKPRTKKNPNNPRETATSAGTLNNPSKAINDASLVPNPEIVIGINDTKTSIGSNDTR